MQVRCQKKFHLRTNKSDLFIELTHCVRMTRPNFAEEEKYISKERKLKHWLGHFIFRIKPRIIPSFRLLLDLIISLIRIIKRRWSLAMLIVSQQICLKLDLILGFRLKLI